MCKNICPIWTAIEEKEVICFKCEWCKHERAEYCSDLYDVSQEIRTYLRKTPKWGDIEGDAVELIRYEEEFCIVFEDGIMIDEIGYGLSEKDLDIFGKCLLKELDEVQIIKDYRK